MNIESKLRQLSRCDYWQTLYKVSKQNGIQLFENKTNLSGLQINFLQWLEIYNFLYDLIARKEYPFLDAEYIKNDIRCDAFLYYRKRQNELELAKLEEERIKSKHKFKGNPGRKTYFDVNFA